jgi:hypothetical protein
LIGSASPRPPGAPQPEEGPVIWLNPLENIIEWDATGGSCSIVIDHIDASTTKHIASVVELLLKRPAVDPLTSIK